MTKQELSINKEGIAIAEDLGVIYNGIQYDAKDEPRFFLFTDPHTRGTFAADDALGAKIGLDRLRQSFEKDLDDPEPYASC